MDYETAKALGDAGFKCKNYTSEFLTDLPDPTLEKLIEACGENFATLTSRSDGKDTYWRAWAITGEDVQGNTPTEAVAHLWLALNQKSK